MTSANYKALVTYSKKREEERTIRSMTKKTGMFKFNQTDMFNGYGDTSEESRLVRKMIETRKFKSVPPRKLVLTTSLFSKTLILFTSFTISLLKFISF